MKKEVENKNSFITDLSSSESSSDESEKEIPIENKEEVKKLLKNIFLLMKKQKTLHPRSQKRLLKKENHLPVILMIKKNQLNQKNQRNPPPKIHPRKHL